jgi:hypothetical protein
MSQTGGSVEETLILDQAASVADATTLIPASEWRCARTFLKSHFTRLSAIDAWRRSG